MCFQSAGAESLYSQFSLSDYTKYVHLMITQRHGMFICYFSELSPCIQIFRDLKTGGSDSSMY